MNYELSNKIANDNSKNYCGINKNHHSRINTNNFNNSRAIQYDVSRNDVNNKNVQKPSSTKRVHIAVDR